jgi:hypothetical protein
MPTPSGATTGSGGATTEDLPHNEIADILDCRTGTAKSLVGGGLVALRPLFGEFPRKVTCTMTDLLRDVLRYQAQKHDFFPDAVLMRARAARRRRRAGRLAGAAVAGAVAVAAGAVIVPRLDDDGGGVASPADEENPENPVIAIERLPDSLPGGEVIGVLELQAGCLVINGSVLVLADPDVTWDAHRQAMVMPDGASYPVGSMVRLGGGGFTLHEGIERVLGARGTERARACLKAVGTDRIALAYHPPTARTLPFPG